MKDERLYLTHILACIERVQRYTARGSAAFFADEMAQDATLRNLQTLAESCTRLPSALRDGRPEIDWRGIGGFRNAVVHDYLHLELEQIWEIVERDLPPLAAVIADELVAAELRWQQQHE
jgi:uncharacterized protein with HEPN domain